MSSVMEVMEYTPELLGEIISDIGDQAGKQAADQIIRLFNEAGLTIKVKHLFPQKPCAYYRVLCFIKKSSEAVIINTKEDDGHLNIIGGMNIQLRILNNDSFARLDELTENIRRQILNAADCRFCSTKCGDKRYVFTYDSKKFTKCQYLCANFRLRVADEDDTASVIALVERELAFAASKSKRKQ